MPLLVQRGGAAETSVKGKHTEETLNGAHNRRAKGKKSQFLRRKRSRHMIRLDKDESPA